MLASKFQNQDLPSGLSDAPAAAWWEGSGCEQSGRIPCSLDALCDFRESARFLYSDEEEGSEEEGVLPPGACAKCVPRSWPAHKGTEYMTIGALDRRKSQGTWSMYAGPQGKASHLGWGEASLTASIMSLCPESLAVSLRVLAPPS